MLLLHETQKNDPLNTYLIPPAIRAEVFRDDAVPKFVIQWMNLSYNELKGQLTSVLSNEEKEKAWIAIALSHPLMGSQQLLDIGQRVGLSISELFNLAVMLGDGPNHLELLNNLAQREPYSDNLFANYILRIQRAAKLGYSRTLNYFIDLTESRSCYGLNDMIALGTLFFVFRIASEYGYLEVLNNLEKKAPGKLQDMIAANNFSAFRLAALNGHLDVLRYLEKKSPEYLKTMIEANNFYAFRSAAFHGRLDVMIYLEERAPERLQDMICANNFYAFQWAAANNHLDVLSYLVEKTTKALHEMIAADTFAAFRLAAHHNNLPVVHYLLNYPSVFAYASDYYYEYGERYLSPFIRKKLTALSHQLRSTIPNDESKDNLPSQDPFSTF